MTKYEEAKKLMELLGIPFQESLLNAINTINQNGLMPYGFGGQAITTAANTYTPYMPYTPNTTAIPSPGGLAYIPYQSTTAYCWTCNSNACTCNTQIVQYPMGTGNIARTAYTHVAEQIPHATIDIEKLYDILSDDEKLKEIISKLKMKAFW